MIRTYRVYRNMGINKDTNQVSLQLFQFPSVFEWLVFELHEAVLECCGLFHHLPIPKWLGNWKRKWGCDCPPDDGDGGCDCLGRFGDYYGEDWGSMWHCFLEIPLQEFLNRREQKRFKAGGHGLQFLDVSLDHWKNQKDDLDVNWIREDIEREKGYGRDEHGYTLAPPRCDYPGKTWLYKLMEWLTRPWRTAPCGDNGHQNQRRIPG